ncbi:GIY-YIG nuclease family protein [Candidatus Nomurabacteria bacterium]|nr:GIY-YIG nuclease family protein [Candidatus Nomurabacteria bacterium]
MFYVYCLESIKYDELYFGYTNDLKRRFKEHNKGLTFSTKKYAPWKLIYYEACLNENDAKRRERYLKTSQGRRMFRKRIKEYILDKYKILKPVGHKLPSTEKITNESKR